MTSNFIDDLRIWFEIEKRMFPWRIDPSPYAVWVSEVMLQQTRASVVIPYFLKWMKKFPSVRTLADSQVEEVLKVWEGLGYYSRARALHEGAKYLVLHHNGKLPIDPDHLSQIKGLGPYTIGAILSFAFHKRAIAVDGNVLRVISRLFAIEEEIDGSKVQKEIREKVEELLPDTQPWVIMEALIELGATLCNRVPKCSFCPLQDKCIGYQTGKAERLPLRKKRAPITHLTREVYVVRWNDFFLVNKNKGKSVMADLYEFPYVEEGNSAPFENLVLYKKLKEVKHTFTRYRARLLPSIWVAETKKIQDTLWVKKKALIDLPFSSGHRQILAQVLEEYEHLTY